MNNTLLECITTDSCKAQCYPGYVFPNGETQRNYSCEDGVWILMASPCKRMFLLVQNITKLKSGQFNDFYNLPVSLLTLGQNVIFNILIFV